jgi:hypothetical protein
MAEGCLGLRNNLRGQLESRDAEEEGHLLLLSPFGFPGEGFTIIVQ